MGFCVNLQDESSFSEVELHSSSQWDTLHLERKITRFYLWKPIKMPTGRPPLAPSVPVCSRKCLPREQVFCQPSCLPRSEQAGPVQAGRPPAVGGMYPWESREENISFRNWGPTTFPLQLFLPLLLLALLPVTFQSLLITHTHSPVRWRRKEEITDLSSPQERLFPQAHCFSPAHRSPTPRTWCRLLPANAFPLPTRVFTLQP